MELQTNYIQMSKAEADILLDAADELASRIHEITPEELVKYQSLSRTLERAVMVAGVRARLDFETETDRDELEGLWLVLQKQLTNQPITTAEQKLVDDAMVYLDDLFDEVELFSVEIERDPITESTLQLVGAYALDMFEEADFANRPDYQQGYAALRQQFHNT
jgi:hypothetical protein